MPQQPGWYDVPGKGERYWDGKNYRFYGPSDTAASRGQGKASSDIGGMWNSFVDFFGSTTSDPSKIGLLPHQKAGFKTRAEHLKALEKKRAELKNKENRPPVDMASLTAGAQDLRAGRVPLVPVKQTGGSDGDGRGRIVEERENINKVRQKGTLLSPMAGANEALRKLGVSTVGYGKFQSNHLPGSNYSPEVEAGLSKIYDPETLHRFDGSVNDLDLSDDIFMDRSGVKGQGSFYADSINYDDLNSIDMMMGEGSPFLVRNGDSPITSIVGSQNKLGTRARYDEEFLNSGDNSMAGLKAAEASKGLLRASGGYYRENPKYGQKGEKDYLIIEKDDFNAIKNSDMNAQDFFASKLAEIKDK